MKIPALLKMWDRLKSQNYLFCPRKFWIRYLWSKTGQPRKINNKPQ